MPTIANRAHESANHTQAEILIWISEGCPERNWPDYSHWTTAKAPQNQGLAKVKGHGSDWTATVTEAGRATLKAAASTRSARRPLTPRANAPAKAVPRPSRGEAPPHAVSAEDLVLPNTALMRYRSAPHDP